MASGRRGFTILEAVLVIAIITVLAALAVGGVMYGVGRARLGNGVFDSASFLTLAKMRGQRTGLYEYAVVYQNGTDAGLRLIESKSAYVLADWQSTAVGAVPAQKNGNPVSVVDSLPLSGDGFGFYALSSVVAPPEPFQAVPHTGTGSAPSLLAACSFCISSISSSSGGAVGVIRFNPDGTVTLPTSTVLGGGTVAFAVSASSSHESPAPKVIAVSAPFGALKVYDGALR